jgi:hypothetical protein
MRSRFQKRKLAGLSVVVVGAGLALLATAALANPFVLDWRVIGFGTVTGTCNAGALAAGCTSTSTGAVQGTHIGSGTYSLTLTAGNDNSNTNSSGGRCFPANGSTPNAVTAADGSTVDFSTVGWLCEEAGAGSSYHYDGTYRITSGTGRFSTVVGGGSLTATFEKNGALVSKTFLKIDGTINF